MEAMTLESVLRLAFDALHVSAPIPEVARHQPDAERKHHEAHKAVREYLEAHLVQPAQAVDVVALRELVEKWRKRESRDRSSSGEYYSGRAHAYDTCSDELEASLTRALSGEKAGPVGGGWQPIETAPKDGTRILLGDPDTATLGWWQEHESDGVDYMGADAGFVDHEFNAFNPSRTFGTEQYRYKGNQPTHWMPLPASPTPDKEGK